MNRCVIIVLGLRFNNNSNFLDIISIYKKTLFDYTLYIWIFNGDLIGIIIITGLTIARSLFTFIKKNELTQREFVM